MTANFVKIEKLEELLRRYMEKDQKIVRTKVTRLTPPGENFGSTMLKVDLTIKGQDGNWEPLNIVAKMIPEDEFFQQIYNVNVTFNMESAFYSTIIPTMQEFQREQGVEDVIDFFPNFYGSRKNLDGGDKIDGNAVILLENLITSGNKNYILE